MPLTPRTQPTADQPSTVVMVVHSTNPRLMAASIIADNVQEGHFHSPCICNHPLIEPVGQKNVFLDRPRPQINWITNKNLSCGLSDYLTGFRQKSCLWRFFVYKKILPTAHFVLQKMMSVRHSVVFSLTIHQYWKWFEFKYLVITTVTT